MSFIVHFVLHVFWYFLLFYIICLSVCLYVLFVCLWARLPESNKMYVCMYLFLFIAVIPTVYSCDRLLSLRTRAAVLSRQQSLLISLLGLRRRGCRGRLHSDS